MAGVKVIGQMKADLSMHSKKMFDVKYGWFKKIFICAYQVDMTIKAACLTFELVYKQVRYAAVTVDFQ
jgi:hypothetical protein